MEEEKEFDYIFKLLMATPNGVTCRTELLLSSWCLARQSGYGMSC